MLDEHSRVQGERRRKSDEWNPYLPVWTSRQGIYTCTQISVVKARCPPTAGTSRNLRQIGGIGNKSNVLRHIDKLNDKQ